MSTVDDSNAGDGAGDESNPGKERSPASYAAESSRKIEQLAKANEQLNSKLDQLMQMQNQALQKPKKQASNMVDPLEMTEEQLETLSYENPKAFSKAVEVRAEARAVNVVEDRLNRQNHGQQIMNQLIGEYPELGDANSELSKKAVEIYNKLPNNQKNDPLSYKIAVRDAAADMGVLTASKRKVSDDGSYTGRGSGGSGSGSSRGQRKETDKLDSATLAFAELVGLDIKDEKVTKRLQTRAARKSWGKYE